ncbi:hypothetical protein ACWATR_09610 [Nostoc sp. UIC 10890]
MRSPKYYCIVTDEFDANRLMDFTLQSPIGDRNNMTSTARRN